jgi:hypothetical protein
MGCSSRSDASGGDTAAGSANGGNLGSTTQTGTDSGADATASGGSATSGNAGTENSGGSAGGGGSSSGGSAGSEVAGGDGSDASAKPPIDYSIWQLQLPIGSGTSPTTLSPKQLLAGFTDDYFYPAPNGGQVFMDPQTGVTTSGSQHCRTEMREMTADGKAAGWPPTGTNTLTVSGKVKQVGGGSKGHVTVAQVFNDDESSPLCELEYSGSGNFEMLYEEQKGGGGGLIDLKTPVALDTQYSFTLSLSDGVLTVSINGKQVHQQMPSAATQMQHFYFKFGNYDQTATAGAISNTPYTIVEAYSAAVVHK